MGDRPRHEDTEKLLQGDLSVTDGDAAYRTSDGVYRDWHKFWGTKLCSIKLISVLMVSNFTSLLVILYLSAIRTASSSCDLPLNQPPQGVTPMLAHLVQKPTPKTINITFFPDGSFFRQHNSKEADAKWAEYDGSNDGFLMIPKEEAEQAGINPSRHAYVDRPDLGAVGYPVLPEAIHHMHCISMLRQNLYYNINHTRHNCHPPTCETPELEQWRIFHVDHCLEAVRHRLECTADLGIVPFMWYGHNGKLTGDMARLHTCSKYDPIITYLHINGVLPNSTIGILKPPKGAFISNYRN